TSSRQRKPKPFENGPIPETHCNGLLYEPLRPVLRRIVPPPVPIAQLRKTPTPQTERDSLAAERIPYFEPPFLGSTDRQARSVRKARQRYRTAPIGPVRPLVHGERLLLRASFELSSRGLAKNSRAVTTPSVCEVRKSVIAAAV